MKLHFPPSPMPHLTLIMEIRLRCLQLFTSKDSLSLTLYPSRSFPQTTPALRRGQGSDIPPPLWFYIEEGEFREGFCSKITSPAHKLICSLTVDIFDSRVIIPHPKCLKPHVSETRILWISEMTPICILRMI